MQIDSVPPQTTATAASDTTTSRCRLLLRPAPPIQGRNRTMVVGTLLGDLCPDGVDRIVDATVIIIASEVLRPVDLCTHGSTVDQVLTGFLGRDDFWEPVTDGGCPLPMMGRALLRQAVPHSGGPRTIFGGLVIGDPRPANSGDEDRVACGSIIITTKVERLARPGALAGFKVSVVMTSALERPDDYTVAR